MTNLSIQKNRNQSLQTTSSQSSVGYDLEGTQKLCKWIDLPVKAFDSGLPSLAKLGKQFGDEQVKDLIRLWIIDFAEFVNIGKNMNGSQIDQTATLILDEFYYFNMADINLVFKRAKTGYYGEIFDRLDGQIILGWFREYNKERCLAAEEKSINQSSGFTDVNARIGERELKRISDLQSKMIKR